MLLLLFCFGLVYFRLLSPQLLALRLTLCISAAGNGHQIGAVMRCIVKYEMNVYFLVVIVVVVIVEYIGSYSVRS